MRAKLIKEEHLARAEELVQQMTLEEKVAQLGSFGPQQLLENGRLSQEEKLLSRGIGQIRAWPAPATWGRRKRPGRPMKFKNIC